MSGLAPVAQIASANASTETSKRSLRRLRLRNDRKAPCEPSLENCCRNGDCEGVQRARVFDPFKPSGINITTLLQVVRTFAALFDSISRGLSDRPLKPLRAPYVWGLPCFPLMEFQGGLNGSKTLAPLEPFGQASLRVNCFLSFMPIQRLPLSFYSYWSSNNEQNQRTHS